MKPKLDRASRLKLIKKALRGSDVSVICKDNGISRGLFYRWLKRYKAEGVLGLSTKESGRPKLNKSTPRVKKYNILSPKARSLMVKEVIDQNSSVIDVSKRYNITRATFYKWLKRYQNASTPEEKEASFVSITPYFEKYFRQTPEKYEKSILSLVASHPEYGVRKLVINLPKIGELPIVGHHGVQNVLRRNSLSTYQQRLTYSTAQNSGIIATIGKMLSPVFSFFSFDSKLRSRILKYSGTVLLSAFTTIVVLGLGAVYANNVIFAVAGSKIGLTFAFLALGMGSIFFLYSLKYYITLAIVLSYSQNPEDGKKRKGLKEGGILSWILGTNAKNSSFENEKQAVGLESDLSGISLNRKPFISVQIPFYNEKNVVERAIRAATNFKYAGEYEVILCDDSTDETTSIIRKYQNDCLFKGESLKEVKGDGWSMTTVEISPRVTLKHIHRTTRDGYKGKALDLALKLSDPRTEFVAIFDADFVPYTDSLELFLKYFKSANGMSEDYKKSKVAAVQGYQWHVLNKSENWVTRGVRGEYAGSYVVERSGAEIYGGLKQISGSVYMIRRDVLAEIGWGTSITEDFELTLRLYNGGYKVLYTPYIQGPAECVSTVRRLVRQRMRWAEGHSFNIKKMFKRLMLNPSLTFMEKFELLYLSPYYLQSFFFLVGTLAWFISETIFRAHLPFWTEVWGWSLILTNMVALPLVNFVGLFMEESEEKDYLGLASFVALSYLLVPFQAYASVKGLLESEEGPWFRTPKTGRITDIFSRSALARFIAGIIPGVSTEKSSAIEQQYLDLNTANNRFDKFKILPKSNKILANISLGFVVLVFAVLTYSSNLIKVGSSTDLPVLATAVKEENFSLTKYFINTISPKVVAGQETFKSLTTVAPAGITDLQKFSLIGLAILTVGFIGLVLSTKKSRSVVAKSLKIAMFTLILFMVSLGDLARLLLSSGELSGSKIADKLEKAVEPQKAKAIYQYVPTSANRVVGTETTVTSIVAAAAAGVNTGGWQATLADDNFHWSVLGANLASAVPNYDVQLNFDGVLLNNANKIVVQTEVDLDAALAMVVQICDWVDSTNVDTAADVTYCTGGGWRTLNSQNASNANVALTTVTTPGGLQWHISNGYFTTGTTGGSAISTPLSNFISNDANKRVKIRFFSTVQSATAIDIDYVHIMPIIDSKYQAGGFTQTTGGTPAGTYANTHVIGNSTTAQQATTTADGVYLTVPGTNGSAKSDFYNSFKDIRTYTGMNTIYVKADYSCDNASGPTYKPKIYNFNSAAWEDLAATAITCSTTDATNAWAKNNVTITDYLSTQASGGEIRIGWYQTANPSGGNYAIRIDFEYVIVGSTNTDTAQCEVTFGSGTATDCANTRNLDGSNASPSVFANTAEDESGTMGHAFYAMDNESTVDTTVEESTSSNITFPVTTPTNAEIVGINYAGRFLAGTSGATAMTVQMGVKDYSGIAQATGGWTQVGGTATSSYVYSDSITALSAALPFGVITNPQDYVDTINNKMNVRLRTTAAGTSTTNAVTNWDFAMVSISWIEESAPVHPTVRYQYVPTSGNMVTGTAPSITSIVAAAGGGVNTGGWQGTLADDNFHWSVNGANAASATNYDVQLNMDGVEMNGGNRMIIQTELDTDAAIALVVQICDWVDPTNVDTAADVTYCTGGGWRTLNSQNASNANVAITTITSGAAFQWQIFDGYFTTGSTGGSTISTPLTNFISNDANKRVKIRYFSTTQSSTAIDIDYLRVTPLVSSIYQAAGFTQITGGTVAGTYANTHVIGNSTTAQQSTTTADATYLSVPGTAGAISDFYLSFKDVETYTGANTIYVKADYSCSTTGISHTPKIYNFTSASWVNLTGSAITCSATDATNAWAVNNITLSDYISNGEIRVGWFGSANSTVAIKLDFIYVIIGSTNSDSAQCEATFGTATPTDCANTRTLDGTSGSPSVFANTAEDESGTMSHAYYAFDNESTPDTTTEEATSSNINFPVTVPTNASVVGINYAARFLAGTSGATALTVQPGIKDYSGFSAATGGWTQVGGTATSAYVYTDSITALAATLPYGIVTNPEDYVDTVNNKMNMRLRPTAAGTSTTNAVTNWDFAMVAISWVYSGPQYNQSGYRFYANTDASPPDVGSALANLNTAANSPNQGTAFRMRILLRNYGHDADTSGGNFKLQIAVRGADNLCDTGFSGESYTDISPSSGNIRYYDNSTLSDGANITTNNANDPTDSAAKSVVRETYDEANNFTNSQNAIRTDMAGKWDFALVDYSAPANTTYCLRVVESDNSVLETYSVIPQFTSVPEGGIIFGLAFPLLAGLIKKLRRRKR